MIHLSLISSAFPVKGKRFAESTFLAAIYIILLYSLFGMLADLCGSQFVLTVFLSFLDKLNCLGLHYGANEKACPVGVLMPCPLNVRKIW